MAKYKIGGLRSSDNEGGTILFNELGALAAIANELADWNEMAKKMYELNKQQLELFKKQVEREEASKTATAPKPVSDKELKDQANHDFFMERIYNKHFLVQAPILGFVVGNPDQGIVAGQMLSGGVFNAALNKIRFELFGGQNYCDNYIGVVDLPIDQVRRDLCESKSITEIKD